jgi:hypothetical protein
MEFEQAKEKLKDFYRNSGLELVDEHQNELFFRYERGRSSFHIGEQEISDFMQCENVRASFQTLPVECSICSTQYREHIVNFSDYDRRRMLPYRDLHYIFGTLGESAIYVEVGVASNLFANYYRLDDTVAQYTLERMRRPIIRENRNNFNEMYDVLYRPLTIRVNNLNAASVEGALKRSSSIIDNCLFELAYLKDITLSLEEELPRRLPRIKPFQFGTRFEGSELPLPRVGYSADILRFYQRGMSTDDPVIQFLSFYQVIEYFFVRISDEQLYSKLSQKINDPKFTTTPANLDRIIQDTITHKRETDETEMLKFVLNRFIDEAELIEFLKAYEAYLGDNLYSKKKSIFGENIEVKLEPNHTIGNIAKRIKVIRNALVHSSDRYERQQRYIPSTSSEKMIHNEIPLMKYLAEKVIIGSPE